MQNTQIRELSDLAISTAIEGTARLMKNASQDSEIAYWKARNDAYVAEFQRRLLLKNELREIVEAL